jgi:tRNA threonylcarbamoyladenosine biosynthesis protein TsaB
MINEKPVLSLETSERICGVCLYFDEEKYFEFSISLKNAHSEKIFDLVNNVLNTSGTEINQVGCIAVSAGPGSFTGLRIGMSTAKGLAFGASLPLVPVPTFEAMAFQLNDFLSDGTEFIIANKVNAEEVYFARFQIKSNNYIFTEKLSIINGQKLEKKSKNALIFGNVNNLKNSKAGFSITAPSAKYVAKWCEKFGSDLLTFNYDFLEPDYLKDFIIRGNKK